MAASSSFGLYGNANFTTEELQILAVTSTSAAGSFTNGATSLDCMIYNNGTAGCYVVFSTTATPTALNAAGNASGTKTSYIAPGAYVVVGKGTAAYFAAITDTGTATLFLHAGRGA